MPESFFTQYLKYTEDSEVPACFSRWCAIVGLGILISRNVWIDHGHMQVFANQYTMLMGSAGTRKGTAIKLMKRLLSAAGVENFSSERTTKEKFFLDLSGDSSPFGSADGNILERNLGFDNLGDTSTHPMNIMVDEANDFFGSGNAEFLSIIGNLWDWNDPRPYKNSIKTGKSVEISYPYISIVAGNTPTGFSMAFPPEIIGQGFFSRLLLVYGEPNGKRIAWPTTPTIEHTTEIIQSLQRSKSYHSGSLSQTDTGRNLLTAIYERPVKSFDQRFDSWNNRRHTHLLKLCIIVASAYARTTICESTVIEANTYLTYIASLMPKALGEFGKAKNSDISHKVLGFIESRDGCSIKEIMIAVSADLEKPGDIGDILRKLSMGDKIISSNGIFLAVRSLGLKDEIGFVDLGYLTEEELAVKG